MSKPKQGTPFLKPCPECEGTGEMKVTDPFGESHTDECSKCEGEGTIQDNYEPEYESDEL